MRIGVKSKYYRVAVAVS